MEKMTVCFYQAFKRKRVFKEGVGDCEICIPHPDNINYKDYLRMSLWRFTVTDKETKGDSNEPDEVLLRSPSDVL